MKKVNLFFGKSGWVTNIDIAESLRYVNAHECEILYIHTGLAFGFPNPELSKTNLLELLFEAIMELRVPTLCVPTFTFSFCNNTDFDLEQSKSKMGALNEYIRKLPNSIRSVDPLMSIALVGEDKDLATGIGHESLGPDSTFHKLHTRDNVKFLFLGTRPGDCFTYMHFIEKFLAVDYRYDRNFTGNIIVNGKTYTDTFTLYVRYKNVFPGKGSYTYEDVLLEKGIIKSKKLGDASIYCFDESPAFEVYKDMLMKDPYFFIDPSSILDHDKSFIVNNMVAL
jgi:aminoglycoside 3-N-acetyltransferase